MRLLPIAIATLLQTASLGAAERIEDAPQAPSPIRKRTQTIQQRQKGEEAYDPYLGLDRPQPSSRRNLQGSEDDGEDEDGASESAENVCTFCPDGLTVSPDFALPTQDGATCGTAMAYAATLSSGEEMCATVQLAITLCCPESLTDDVPAEETPFPTGSPPAVDPDDETPAITTPPVEIVTGVPVSSDICSCSPREYSIELNLDQDCNIDDLDGAPGIGLTFCFLGSSEGNGNRRSLVRRKLSHYNFGLPRQMKGENLIRQFGMSDFQPINEGRQLDAEDIEIVSIQFLEFDTTGDLIVINQDDTYANTTLKTGDVATFKSISNELDPDLPINEQLDYLPGGVQITMRGRILDAETGEEEIVSNRITWSYSMDCQVEPIQTGSAIGWATFFDIELASGDFCPVTATSTTTTEAQETTATTTTTTTTETIVTTTEATDPPVVTTTTPHMSISMSMETTTTTTATTTTTTTAPPPPIFGKSSKGSKSKSSKIKKESVIPKAQKTPKNPMAKVMKESDMDSADDHDESSKAGKALADLDAKAEKASKSAKISSKAAKTKSSKGMSYDSASKSSKSSKSGDKSGKAKRLFHKAEKTEGSMRM
mmetsp:Transcript_30477/g.51993  ORF Transcript_30477/g.51993 Transcript_30477/m.51993 type:complete len:598 (-) Transcript_30477:299-2092(-)